MLGLVFARLFGTKRPVIELRTTLWDFELAITNSFPPLSMLANENQAACIAIRSSGGERGIWTPASRFAMPIKLLLTPPSRTSACPLQPLGYLSIWCSQIKNPAPKWTYGATIVAPYGAWSFWDRTPTSVQDNLFVTTVCFYSRGDQPQVQAT